MKTTNWTDKDFVEALLKRKRELLLQWQELADETGICKGTLLRMNRMAKLKDELFTTIKNMKRIKAFLERTENSF